MTAAAEIPEDIRDTAKAIAEQPWLTRAERDSLTSQIATAVLAERERCAGLLDGTAGLLKARGSGEARATIAAVLVDCAEVIRTPGAREGLEG